MINRQIKKSNNKMFYWDLSRNKDIVRHLLVEGLHQINVII